MVLKSSHVWLGTSDVSTYEHFFNQVFPHSSLQYRQSVESTWVYFISEQISPSVGSFVMKGLKPDSEYHVKLAAKNRFGMGEFDLYHEGVHTLDFNPVFVPEARVKGLTWNSISIRWSKPREERISAHIDYYKLTKRARDQEVNMYQPADKFSFYLWRAAPGSRDQLLLHHVCLLGIHAGGRHGGWAERASRRHGSGL